MTNNYNVNQTINYQQGGVTSQNGQPLNTNFQNTYDNERRLMPSPNVINNTHQMSGNNFNPIKRKKI